MSAISLSATASINPIIVTEVFSNSSLRSLIFSDIWQSEWMSVLPVCKLFLVGGSETLYREFDYRHYNKLIKRCSSKERLNLYLSSVIKIDLSKLTRTIQVSKWSSLLSPFPNAISIKRYHDILYRHDTSSPNSTDEPEYTYTYSYPYSEQLSKSSKPIPPLRPGIPKIWKQVKRITLNSYKMDFGEDEDGNRDTEWSKAFLRRIKELNQPIEGISIDFPISNKIVLNTLKEVNEMGLGTPKHLSLRSSDQDLFESLELVSPTLSHFHIWKVESTNCGISINDFFTKIPWKKLRCLSIIKLSVKRTISEDLEEEQPFKSIKLDENPFGINEFHFFSEFNFHLTYTEKDDIEFEEQIAKDLKSITTLSTLFVKLLFPNGFPSTTITHLKSEITEDIVKSNKWSRAMNDGIWDEMSRIRKDGSKKLGL